MTSYPEAMGWGFGDLEKTVSWDSTLDEGSWFSGARRGQTSSLQWGAARGGVRWKSQICKKLCMSLLLMSKNFKLKKVNKSCVPEPEESRQCFVYFGIPSVYFAYSYHGRIFGPIYVTIFYTLNCLPVYEQMINIKLNIQSLIAIHGIF